MGNNWPAYVIEPETTEPAGLSAVQPRNQVLLVDAPEYELDCLIEIRPEDVATGVQFRDCLIDYTRCPNRNCVKKLV